MNLKQFFRLFEDHKSCAELVGLHYCSHFEDYHQRRPWRKAFRYYDGEKLAISDRLISYFESLAIPPAWRDVRIAKSKNSHILVEGLDGNGRAQYIYHDKWKEFRRMLNFYKLIPFYKGLGELRLWFEKNKDSEDVRIHELAMIFEVLFKYYLRIGNELYEKSNQTFGITTLQGRHVHFGKNGIKISYKAKSNKTRTIELDDQYLEDYLEDLHPRAKSKVFAHWNSSQVNDQLRKISGYPLNAKDFRTWGGTFVAYKNLCLGEVDSAVDSFKKSAEVLGNTASVAKKSYVHSDMIWAYGEADYQKYFSSSNSEEKLEQNLIRLLKKLYKEKFLKDFDLHLE